jgi:hypothetical protein
MNYNRKLVEIFNIFSVQSIIFQYKSNAYYFEYLKKKKQKVENKLFFLIKIYSI